MNDVFKKRPYVRVSFLQKILGRKPKENALIELEEDLAEMSIDGMEPAKRIDIEERYGVQLFRRFPDETAALYRRYLRFCLVDGVVGQVEEERLEKLKRILGLNDAAVSKVHEEVAEEVYRRKVEEALADNRLSEEERTFLDALENRLKLPKLLRQQIYREAAGERVKKFLENAFSDERISDEEEKELNAIAGSLGLDVRLEKKTRKLYEKYRLFWQLENDDLPEIDSDIRLHKRELCHFTASVGWYERRKVRVRANYSGPTLRVKIAKGFYWRAGSLNVAPQYSEEWRALDSGRLFLTNKRIIFMGGRGNKNIRYNRILDFDVYQDGIEIQKDSGKNPFIELAVDPEVPAMILGRLLFEEE